MKTEAWLKRKIELKEQLIRITQEEIDEMRRELAHIQSRTVKKMRQHKAGYREPQRCWE